MAATESVADRIYARLAAAEVGEVIDYQELGERLGFNLKSRQSFYRAVERLQSDRKRTAAVVTGVGYQIVPALEHERLARVHHRKAGRQLGRAVRKIESADRAGLAPEERARFDHLEMVLKRQQEAIRHLQVRADRQEQALDTLRQQSAQETGGLAERLQRVEALIVEMGGRQPAA